ncbi:PQQ-binding-like beta-propeller repeat protein [Actinoplanes sp. NPDC051861]|uniref:outer membrane protein assembly factor BamB family protein n=1 Tax=Actinoplanes sp. NPDC051861 TaxID=3155170 RepID=UPI00343B8406
MTRVLLRTLAALVLLAATGLIAWRVLAPAEVLSSATTPYPPESLRSAGVTGRTSMAPLIVDGRLRVYGAKHQVKADAPVDGRTLYTARWSFRRWPEQLSGLTASGPTVISRWSDGELVALDARTGKIFWRTDGPAAPRYAGHRTGAAAVWDPPGLHLAAGTVVVHEGQKLMGYDVSTGQTRWTRSTPPACDAGFTTSGGAFVCGGDGGAYAGRTGDVLTGYPSGPVTPIGCESEMSDCAGLRTDAGQGWLADSLVPVRTPALDAPTATVAAGVIVSAGDGSVRAFSDDGTPLWTWAGAARILGGSGPIIVLLTGDNTLVGLDAQRGTVRYSFPFRFDEKDSLEWKPGRYRISGGYLAVERLRVDANDDPESPTYYLTLDAVIIAAVR